MSFFQIQLRLKHALDVAHSSSEHIKRLGLIKSELLEIVPRILLKYESTVPSENISFIERSHDLLYEVHVLIIKASW